MPHAGCAEMPDGACRVPGAGYRVLEAACRRLLSLTPNFSWVHNALDGRKPFKRFHSLRASHTQLKLGVNERDARCRVLETACRQGEKWQRIGHGVRLGVNLSPAQLQSGDLAEAVASKLRETGLSPSLLELEVTENIVLEDDQAALEFARSGLELYGADVSTASSAREA